MKKIHSTPKFPPSKKAKRHRHVEGARLALWQDKDFV